MIFKGYTKRDTSILKGFAILCIVFHNFFHWTYPAPGENEFSFSADRIFNLFTLLGDKPGEFINLLFSYFGHFGVQIFVMISGFGLTLSMMKHGKDWGCFMWSRLKKLYPLLLVGIIVCFIGLVMMEKRSFNAYEWKELGYKLLFIHTLIPDSGLSINGPWWFFALILQLYMLFPLLYKGMRRWGWKLFLVVCVICYGLVFLFRYHWTLYHGYMIMMNAPGHLPEFCFGILLAFHKDRKVSLVWLLLAVVAFVFGNFYEAFYPFTFLSVAAITVFAYQGLKSLRFKKSWIGRPLASVGGISMLLFAVHGYFRIPFITLINNHWNNGWGKLGAGLLFFAFSSFLAVGTKPLYEGLCRPLDRIKLRESRVSRIIGGVLQIALGCFFALVMTYFILQNVHKKDQAITEYEARVESGVVTQEVEYVLLAKTMIDDRWLSLDLSGSFDISCSDPSTPMPYIIFEIGTDLWKRFDIPEEYRSTTPKRYDFSYTYNSPFVKSMKGKQIKVYFWNPNKGLVRFENAQINLMH